MLNRFRIALHGPQAVTGDSGPTSDYVYKDSKLERRECGSLTRSPSLREELLNKVARNRAKWNKTNESDPQRGQTQIPRSLSLDGGSEGQAINSTSNQRGNFFKRNQNVTGPDQARNGQKMPKFPYSRPEFLQLKTEDEINVSADHVIRPIILPRDVTRLPWMSGYAECINAGKSSRNEDQAVCHQDVIVGMNSRPDSIKGQIPFTLFGLYDGHAGDAVAVAAANQLHHIISEKLRLVADLLIALEFPTDDLTLNNQDSNDDDDSGKYTSMCPSGNERDTSVQDDGLTTGQVKPNSYENASTNDQVHSLISQCQRNDSGLSNGSCEVVGDEPHDDLAEKRPDSSSDLLADCQDEQVAFPPNTDSNEGSLDNEPIESAPLDQSRHPNTIGHDSPSYLGLDERLYSAHLGVTVESLVKGALEASFWEMDEIIGRDKEIYKMPGGCAAIVSLFILGKLYVCNAGDSRAIVSKGKEIIPMSFDFTPTSERDRLLRLAHQQPGLLGNEFTNLRFIRRPTREDLGKQMLYRDAYMTGWSMKEISYDDLRIPLVWGEGKRSRLCACIGLSRGFGDHELRAQYGAVPIKPFLTPEPEVRVLNLEEATDLTNEDVLIQASDGLWDVASNHTIAHQIDVSLMLENEVARSKYRYVSVAQDLVLRSRGFCAKNRAWRMSNGRFASMDDISVFVVPLKQYRDEYLEWKRLRNEATLPRLQSKSSDRE